MGLRDGNAICDGCGLSTPASAIPRGWLIISGGRVKESCVRIRLSYGLRENGDQSLLESFTKKTGVWCGISCLFHFAHAGNPRGFGSISHMVKNHMRGRPRRRWQRSGCKLQLRA